MITTIIFDLGGVLYHINHSLTRDALTALARDPGAVNLTLEGQADIFSSYEAGKISSSEFRDCLRENYGICESDTSIDIAWNAMLGGIYNQSIALLQSIKSHYNVYLLSNINDIHFQSVESECRQLFAEFQECFFSYKLGMRKPEAEIYLHVLSRTHSLPEETLFIDDAPQNIFGAQKLGMNTFHVTSFNPLTKESLFVALK